MVRLLSLSLLLATGHAWTRTAPNRLGGKLVNRNLASFRSSTRLSSSSGAKTDLDLPRLAIAARDARGLALDAISACKSGHLGLPLGCAEIGAMLWAKHLKYNPGDPEWLNRDRFVLSAGHGSMFLYAWLHLAGYSISLDDIRRFRKLSSITPGHPESRTRSHCTPGVEATTGPLGTGIGNAVGMAAAAKLAAAKFNTPSHTIIDHDVIALCGDGCLQEGVAFEATSFAAHEGLDNLIVIFDNNNVTLDKMASFTQSEDHALRFQALGWNVIAVDGHCFETIDRAIYKAKHEKNGKPTLIIAKTLIGKGIEEVQGKSAAHGESGVAFQTNARQRLGLPNDSSFFVSEETHALFTKQKKQLNDEYEQWKQTYQDWQSENPTLAAELEAAQHHRVPSPDELFNEIPLQDPNKSVATRQSAGEILQYIAKAVPQYVSGAADLHSSTKNYIKDGGDFGKAHGDDQCKTYAGRNLFFGIREHAMGAMLNGFAYYGLNIASGATFLIFSDYMRPTIRIAALAELPVHYIFTHDSIAVGEDGPTHQPVETIASLRVIPNLDVIRPADPEEVVGAFAAALEKAHGPTALILSRQNVPTLSEIPAETRRRGVLLGAYVALQETSPLGMILIATGSELSLAMSAAKILGPFVRVVSMPCMERFDRQSAEYQKEILPPSCAKRIAIEAGVPHSWYKYTGTKGHVIGVDNFGASGSGEELMKMHGFSVENIVDIANKLH